jgi:ankyrin repeat protein
MTEAQNNFEDEFLSAIESANVTALQYFHANHTDFQSYCNRKYQRPDYTLLTPISLACVKGCIDVAQFLLGNAKIDLEMKNNCKIKSGETGFMTYYDVTVLWIAVVHNNFNFVRLLVEHGARVKKTSSLSVDPLRWAMNHDYKELVHYLTEQREEQSKIEDPRWKLQTAVEEEDFNTIHDLVEKLAVDVNICDEDGRSMLELAVRKRFIVLIKYLLEHGARNDQCSPDRLSPLLIAVELRQTNIMEIILPYCSIREQIEAKELLASQHAEGDKEKYDFQKCLTYLRESFELRSLHQLVKEVKPTMLPLIHRRDECRTIEEWEDIAKNSDEICIEALLIRERLLGPTCEEFRRSVGCRGAFLIDENKHEQGLSLWFYEAKLRRKYSLSQEKNEVLRSIIVFREMLEKSMPIDVRHVQEAFHLFLEDIGDGQELYTLSMFTALCFVTSIARVSSNVDRVRWF